MNLTMNFEPMADMTVAEFVQRLRVSAAIGDYVYVVLPPDAARRLARDLEAFQGRGQTLDMDAEVHRRALQLVADQQGALAAKIEAKEAELRKEWRRFAHLLLALIAITTLVVTGARLMGLI